MSARGRMCKSSKQPKYELLRFDAQLNSVVQTGTERLETTHCGFCINKLDVSNWICCCLLAACVGFGIGFGIGFVVGKNVDSSASAPTPTPVGPHRPTPTPTPVHPLHNNCSIPKALINTSALTCGSFPDQGCDKTIAINSVTPPGPYGNVTTRAFKLALWHEGYPLKGNEDNDSLFDSYVTEMVSYAIAWRLTRVYLQISPPESYTIYEPSKVVARFVKPLATAGIEPAFLTDIHPSDTAWPQSTDGIPGFNAVIAYINNVNQAARNANCIGGDQFCTIRGLVFDKEDLGAAGIHLSQWVATMKANGTITAGLSVGFAGGTSLVNPVASDTGITSYFPELYWYGDLGPGAAGTASCNCDLSCINAMPCFNKPCVQTLYRTHLNDPDALLQALQPIMKSAGITSGLEKQAGSASNTSVWPLIAIGHLSGCCPERAYGPKNECGTFDAFGLWSAEKFLEYLQKLAVSLGYTQSDPLPIVIYEWQFVPPHWRNHSLSANPVLAEAVSPGNVSKNNFFCPVN